MLKKILDKSYYSFHESFDDWRDAIKSSYIPLLENGIVNDCYVDAVIRSVEEYGPYIVLMKDVAMPHSNVNEDWCKETTIAFMKVKKTVIFDPNDNEKQARLFFSLSILDNDEHVKNLQDLMEILENEELISELLEADNEHMFRKIVDKYK